MGATVERLRDVWADGPRTLLGLQVAGFPNFFTITGPGSPSVHTNMVMAIEQHVDWIADCLVHLRDNGNDHGRSDRRSARRMGRTRGVARPRHDPGIGELQLVVHRRQRAR